MSVLMQSTRCCKGGIPYATVSALSARGEIHVTLHDTPCCSKEFESFLAILLLGKRRLVCDAPFFLLYNLTQCKFNPKLVAAQEKALHGAAACVVISNSKLVRSAIKLATAIPRDTKIKICDTPADGIRWLRKIESKYK